MATDKRKSSRKKTSNALYNMLVWGNELRNEEVHLARARKHMLNENYEEAYDEAYRAIMFNPHSEAAQEIMFQSTQKSIAQSAELRRANVMGNYRYQGKCCGIERSVEERSEEICTAKTSLASDIIESKSNDVVEEVSVSIYSEDESIDSIISKTSRPSSVSGTPNGSATESGRNKQIDQPSSHTVRSGPPSSPAVAASTPRTSVDSNAPGRSIENNPVNIRGSVQTSTADGAQSNTDSPRASTQSTTHSSGATINTDTGSTKSKSESTASRRSKTSSGNSVHTGSHHVRISVPKSDVTIQGSACSFGTDTVTEGSIISKHSENSGTGPRDSVD